MPTVLVVDDDIKLLKMLQRTLKYENFNVLTADNGVQALSVLEKNRPDLIIVDWLMPEMDGLTFIQRLRDAQDKTMILMLTARDAIEDRVDGLESGADDYLVKPFAPTELVARVRALLRRTDAIKETKAVSFADVTLDPVTHQARRSGVELPLTVTEFNLLHLFLLHPHQVLERELILNRVWGYDFSGDDNVIEVYIGYLRKKMEDPHQPRLIHTVRGVGYVLREE